MERQQLLGEVLGWVERKSRELDDVGVAIGPETNLLETGLLDSLAFVELVNFIECQTGQMINLLEIDPESFTTVRGLCDAALVSPRG